MRVCGGRAGLSTSFRELDAGYDHKRVFFVDGITGTQLASDPFGETFAVAGRGGREVRFRRLASAFAGQDGFAELLLSHRDPVLALAHPNLVGTVAIARDGKGRLIVAEGLPSGPSLAACLEVATRAGNRPGREVVLAVARALLSGLAHLHGAGLVHGLIHPRSVYLDAAGAVRLGDIAVGHAVAVTGGLDELADSSQPVDARLDVHRAGALIRQLVEAAGDDELATRLAEVIERATAPDPRERHADGGELLVHLNEVAGPADDAAAQREVARVVADTLAALPLVETSSAEAVELAGAVGDNGLADEDEEVPPARAAAPTVERLSVPAPGGGLGVRLRSLPRVPLLLIAAESIIALLLVAGLMSDAPPAPGPMPAATAIPTAPLPVEPAAAAPEASPARCVLNVRSSPAEATVMIDGLSAGITPVSVVGLACDRQVTVAVDKIGFDTLRKRVQLADGEPFHLQAALQRSRVMLRVASTPAGAQVAINGKPVGKSPLAVELDAAAQATVLLQMKGYRPYRTNLVPSATREITAQLVPLRRPASAKGRTQAKR